MLYRTSSPIYYLTNPKSLFSALRFSSQLVVSRLSFYTTNEDLKNMFSAFGKVKEARLVMDSASGRSKGFGFVTFETEDEAHLAVKAMNARIVQGRLIFVEFANKRTH